MSPPIETSEARYQASPLSLEHAIKQAQDQILAQQAPDGYWWYTLQANETIGSGTIMLHHFLDCVDPAVEAGLCRRLLDEQADDGSWNLSHGATGDLSATIEAYLALRLAGYQKDHAALEKARRFILSRGGLSQMRVFSRIHLALFGLIPWSACPAMPTWLIFMPLWTRFSIYEFSSWARASIVPLLIIMDKKPVRPVTFDLNELSAHPLNENDWQLQAQSKGLSWERFFIVVDRILKLIEKLPWHPGKKWAAKACESWVRDHLARTEDIYPALAYGAMALGAMGYSTRDPHLNKALAALKKFQQIYVGELPENSDPISLSHPIENHPVNTTLAHPVDSASIRIHQQCCISPLWDTPWNITALLASGIPSNDARMQKAARYLIQHQIKEFKGDWAVKRPRSNAGGWAFEFENDFFPDVDDTIQILNILKDVELPESETKLAMARGLSWLYAMQSDNGGWAAFDVDNTANWVNKIPFSDHGACQDPPTADITGRMIGLLAQFGANLADPVVRKALHFIESDQHVSDDPALTHYIKGSHNMAPTRQFGAWWGRWGVNYLYGTWCVLSGLNKVGIPKEHAMIQRAVAWLKAVQCSDGGWGESCNGYLKDHFLTLDHGVPSQTAWALLALIAAGEHESPAVRRGIDFLLQNQNDEGVWDEPEHTGTGFPGHFYLRYHGYRHYFPLLALGTYQHVETS